MSRFASRSTRRFVAALALATTTAVPALAIIAGQTPATASAAQTTTVSPLSVNWH
jgi:hypothetical protein